MVGDISEGAEPCASRAVHLQPAVRIRGGVRVSVPASSTASTCPTNFLRSIPTRSASTPDGSRTTSAHQNAGPSWESKGLGVRRQRVPIDAVMSYEVWIPRSPCSRQSLRHLTDSTEGKPAGSSRNSESTHLCLLCSTELPRLSADGAPELAGHDNVTKKAEPRHSCGGLHFLCCTAVGLAGVGVTVRMVVGKGEGAAVVAQDGVEDLSRTGTNERSTDPSETITPRRRRLAASQTTTSSRTRRAPSSSRRATRATSSGPRRRTSGTPLSARRAILETRRPTLPPWRGRFQVASLAPRGGLQPGLAVSRNRLAARRRGRLRALTPFVPLRRTTASSSRSVSASTPRASMRSRGRSCGGTAAMSTVISSPPPRIVRRGCPEV